MSPVPRRHKTFTNRSIRDMAVRAGAPQLTHHDGSYSLLRRLFLSAAYRVIGRARAVTVAVKRTRINGRAMRLAVASAGMRIHGHRETPGEKTTVGKTFTIDGKRAPKRRAKQPADAEPAAAAETPEDASAQKSG